MATTKGQRNSEARKKYASKLALAEATKEKDYNDAVEIFKQMNYSEKDAKIAASVLRDKYYAELKRQLSSPDLKPFTNSVCSGQAGNFDKFRLTKAVYPELVEGHIKNSGVTCTLPHSTE